MAGHGAPAGHQAPADEVWGLQPDRMTRLEYLAALPPQGAPDGVHVHPGDAASFIGAFRNYAMDHVEPELLHDRRTVWDQERPGGVDPAWRYLRHPNGQQAHEALHGWARVIKEDLGCDDRACQTFVTLFNTRPAEAPYGFMEACRVLAHIFKDKNKNLADWVPDQRNWSKFMHRACDEAIDALKVPAHVRDLRHPGKGWSDHRHFGPGAPPPGKGGHAVPPPPVPGKGFGKKGKGQQYLQEGPRHFA